MEFAYGGAGAFALRVPALDIAPGKAVACIGPSGCGKTTLINLIAGIITPARGEVRVGSTAVSALGDAARRAFRASRIGMVFQEFELLEYLSALDNILLPYRISAGLRVTRETRERARTLAQDCGIEHTLGRRPRRLSQGERQRVAICRALITLPELVLCDEPTGNLDPRTAATTLDLLFRRVRAAGATMVMVTHNHGVLDRFDEVIDLADGAARIAPRTEDRAAGVPRRTGTTGGGA